MSLKIKKVQEFSEVYWTLLLDDDMKQRAIKMDSKTIQDDLPFKCWGIYKNLIKKAYFLTILVEDTADV